MNGLQLLLAILLVIFLVGAWPGFGWGWGYYPSGIIGLILLILIVLVVTGRV